MLVPTGAVGVPVNVELENIVALDSFVTLPSPISDDVSVTAPVLPATLVTAEVGVNNSCQFARVEAPVVFSIKDLFKSVLTAISPTSAVRANIAVCEETTNVSVIANAGNIDVSNLPLLSKTGTLPAEVPVFLLAAVPASVIFVRVKFGISLADKLDEPVTLPFASTVTFV